MPTPIQQSSNQAAEIAVIGNKIDNIATNLQDHVRECSAERLEQKRDLETLHSRITELLTKLQHIGILEHKVVQLAAELDSQQRTTSDYLAVKERADFADKAVKGLGTVVLLGVLTALLALVIK